MDTTTYALAAAKLVFRMYWIDLVSGEIFNRRFGRDALIRFVAQLLAGRVALEACGSGHWWARKIKALGHEVVLLYAKFICPFVQTNKDRRPGRTHHLDGSAAARNADRRRHERAGGAALEAR